MLAWRLVFINAHLSVPVPGTGIGLRNTRGYVTPSEARRFG